MTAGSDEVDLELDGRGLVCPQPVIVLARRVGDVPLGGVVAIVATDPAARIDVAAWCRMTGQEFLGEDTAADGAPRYRVRRAT